MVRLGVPIARRVANSRRRSATERPSMLETKTPAMKRATTLISPMKTKPLELAC